MPTTPTWMIFRYRKSRDTLRITGFIVHTPLALDPSWMTKWGNISLNYVMVKIDFNLQSIYDTLHNFCHPGGNQRESRKSIPCTIHTILYYIFMMVEYGYNLKSNIKFYGNYHTTRICSICRNRHNDCHSHCPHWNILHLANL